ncbi:hypothetical protein [Peribacillus sp. SCS-155]
MINDKQESFNRFIKQIYETAIEREDMSMDEIMTRIKMELTNIVNPKQS